MDHDLDVSDRYNGPLPMLPVLSQVRQRSTVPGNL